MEETSGFSTRLPAWKEWQATPWGRLRYSMAAANLRRHLPAPPLQILDVGGGNGLDAIPLAVQGHLVTLVDSADSMLAEGRAIAAVAGVADQITFRHADVTDLPHLFGSPGFDLVLCHNLLQYMADVPATLRRITPTLARGGLLSVISPNRYSEVYAQALREMALDTALAQLDAPTVSTLFGVPAHRYTAEEMIQWLADAGLVLLGHYGIRCVCDYIADDARKSDPAFFAQLEHLELTLSDRYPYYLLARFFHLIATKAD